MKLLIATHNAGKIREFERILSPLSVERSIYILPHCSQFFYCRGPMIEFNAQIFFHFVSYNYTSRM